MGALPQGETLEDLKKDEERWRIEFTSDGRPYPGYAVLPTKFEGTSLILHEVDHDINSTRKDVMQMSLKMNKQALENVKKSPSAPSPAPVAA